MRIIITCNFAKITGMATKYVFIIIEKKTL